MRALVVVALLLVVVGALWFVTTTSSDPVPLASGSPSSTDAGPTMKHSAAGAPVGVPTGTVAVHAIDERAPAAGLADAPTACIVVVEHGTTTPVAGAAVRRVHNGDEIAFTDERGRAALALREQEQLAVVRDGYLLRLVPARLGTTEAEPQQVLLVRDRWSPRLSLQFRAPDGAAVPDAFVRFRAVATAGVQFPSDDPIVQRAWTEHGMLAGRPVCADVPVELGVYAAGRVHRLADRQEVRFVVPGTYEAEVATLSGLVARLRVQAATGVGPDAPVVPVDLAPGGVVAGTVVGGDRAEPLALAKVTLAGGDPLGLVATTTTDGAFRLAPLLPGTITLEVHHADHEPQTNGPLQPPLGSVRVQMRPLPRSTLRGRVRSRPGLQPVANATVLWSPAGGAPVTTTTAADGTFVLPATGTTPARLLVQVPSHVVYAELVEPGAPFADYDVLPGTTEARLAAKLTALLEGAVVDAKGAPQAGVSVRWVPQSRSVAMGAPGRRVLEGGALDLPLVVATGNDGAFRLETHHFGPGRLVFATGDSASQGGVATDAVPGSSKNGLRLQR